MAGAQRITGTFPAAEPHRSPAPALLWALAAAGVLAAGTVVALAYTSERVQEPALQTALVDWMLLPYVVAGLIAWSRRPASRLGPLMVAAGFGIFASIIGWTDVPLLFTIGQTSDLVALILFLHVFLAFPSGRLEPRSVRLLVGCAYLTAVGLMLVRGALGEFGDRYLFAVADAPATATSVRSVQLLAICGVCLAALGVLVARRRGSGRPRRRSVALLVDAFAIGLLMVVALLVAGQSSWPAFETIRRVTFFVIGLAPIAFLIGLLDVRLARTSVGDLLVALRAKPAPAELRDALARALRDPTLELAYWLPDYEAYGDLDGRPVHLPDVGGEDPRATTLIERDGARIAALIHDPALGDEPELLEAVSAAAAMALENAQLQAELRARAEELQGSRGRILEAGQRERQRLERNLHDGAQQRLVGLSLSLGLLEERLATDAGARAGLAQARQEVGIALQELRDIARGIHPAVVSGHGLGVALESLAARMQMPVRLSVELEDRLPEPLEVAAYYVVSESLANVAKHAHASATSVRVARRGGRIAVEVADDGIGGADSERGSGLRGLADRVEALGGRLRVWSAPGAGTRVLAELPCES
jgi:signal transduction histidine kinase